MLRDPVRRRAIGAIGQRGRSARRRHLETRYGKERLRPATAPAGELLLKIKTNGAEFQADQISAGEVLHLVCRNDGKETTNALPNGNQLKSRYRFENGMLLAN